MLPVFSRKIIFSFLGMIMLLSPMKAQYAKYHYSDLRHFNLGFTMGLGIYGYNITRQLNQYDPIRGIRLRFVEPKRQPGIYLGLITNFKLTEHIDFRFQPSVSLEQRNFDFYFKGVNGDSIVEKKIEASNLNLPFALKFKSDFYRNYRVYGLAGVQYSINLASNKKVLNDPDLLKTDGQDFGIIAAFGIDLYGEKLKLTPEIRYVFGVRNIYINENTRFPFAISDLQSQALIFTLNFE